MQVNLERNTQLVKALQKEFKLYMDSNGVNWSKLQDKEYRKANKIPVGWAPLYRIMAHNELPSIDTCYKLAKFLGFELVLKKK